MLQIYMEYILDKHIVSGCLYHVPDWACSTGWSMVDLRCMLNVASLKPLLKNPKTNVVKWETKDRKKSTTHELPQMNASL